jgi:hypothetical protein
VVSVANSCFAALVPAKSGSHANLGSVVMANDQVVNGVSVLENGVGGLGAAAIEIDGDLTVLKGPAACGAADTSSGRSELSFAPFSRILEGIDDIALLAVQEKAALPGSEKLVRLRAIGLLGLIGENQQSDTQTTRAGDRQEEASADQANNEKRAVAPLFLSGSVEGIIVVVPAPLVRGHGVTSIVNPGVPTPATVIRVGGSL